MKLAAISHLASAEAPTGAEKSLAYLIRALAGRGHETAVVAPGPWCLGSAVSESTAEMVEIPSRACWLVQAGDQPVLRQALRYVRYRLPDPGYRRMMVWLDRYWPEVVYVNCLPQLKGAAAARALGLPVVWHIREILPPGVRRRWFARRLKRDATRIVAVSHAVEEWLLAEGLGDRVEVIHNGCPKPSETAPKAELRSEMGLPETGVLTGFFAQLIDHKGVFDLVEAAELAMARQPRLGVVFAGEGPALTELRNAIASSVYGERFFVQPPRPEIWDLLAVVDIVAVPSRWPDPLPRTVMEAMAAGRPVVAYRTGGVPEMVIDGETGMLVDQDNIEGLSKALSTLAGDGGLRERMGDRAARHAREEFSLDRHVDAMEKVLKIASAARAGTGEASSDASS